eukprot:6189989-Heterocapsa_arctica.AAC.1
MAGEVLEVEVGVVVACRARRQPNPPGAGPGLIFRTALQGLVAALRRQVAGSDGVDPLARPSGRPSALRPL